LLLEHGHDQAVRCRELLAQAGFAGIFSQPDLAGIERVTGGRLA
jgi:release factor glutamine methyltransferase